MSGGTRQTPRHARPSTSMPPESVMLGRVLVLAVVVVALAVGGVLGAAVARAASNDPTPYDVTVAGITFPEPLPAHGHINVRTTDQRTYGLHLDPNPGHPGHPWIGATFVPWSAFGIPASSCVAWVQVSTYSEHYGEGGQPPVCLTPATKEPTPCPTPTPSTTSSPVPTSSPTPTASPSPTATPVSEPSPQPSTSSPSPTSTPSPSSTPTTSPAPSPTPTSVAPSASPSHTPTPAPTVSLGPAPSPAPSSGTSVGPVPGPSAGSVTTQPTPSGSGSDARRTTPPELAATGMDAGAAFIVVVIFVVAGVIAIGLARPPRTKGDDR